MVAARPYRELRNELDTGDIVLFSGKGHLSAGIKWFTGSGWSHVGMVLRKPADDMIFLWESTTLSNLRDVEDGRAKRGVQLVLLSQRLQTYDGDIAIRRLIDVDRAAFKEPLEEFRGEVRDRPYEKSRLDLVRSAYTSWFDAGREDLSSLFCSELVAETYQRMGLLHEPPQGKASDNYCPRDFASDGKHGDLRLLNGRLEPEQPVAWQVVTRPG